MTKVTFLIAALAGGLTAAAIGAPAPAAAQVDHRPMVQEFVEANLVEALKDPQVIQAVKAQNEQNAALSQSEVDQLDQQWRDQVGAGGGSLVDSTLQGPLSSYLTELKNAHQGVVTELFVMDAKGLNVGQSDPTSDYWQGDEAKWQQSFGEGPNAMFIDEVEQDESTQELQSQASFTIVDPETGEAIGAVTAGINLDMLDM